MFYPRRRVNGDLCSDYDPRIMCLARRLAVVNGSFGYDQRRLGYYCTEILGAFELPVMLDACPFCHELLPGEKARKRFFDKLESETPKQLPPPKTDPQYGEMDIWTEDEE